MILVWTTSDGKTQALGLAANSELIHAERSR
jgi:hypothetical protein